MAWARSPTHKAVLERVCAPRHSAKHDREHKHGAGQARQPPDDEPRDDGFERKAAEHRQHDRDEQGRSYPDAGQRDQDREDPQRARLARGM
jgi:hypothetical protein